MVIFLARRDDLATVIDKAIHASLRGSVNGALHTNIYQLNRTTC